MNVLFSIYMDSDACNFGLMAMSLNEGDKNPWLLNKVRVPTSRQVELWIHKMNEMNPSFDALLASGQFEVIA